MQNCPKFSSEPCDSCEKFVNAFNRFAQANGWDNVTKRQWLSWRLSEYAVDYYEGLEQADRTTFDKIVEKLKERFQAHVGEEAALGQAVGRSQRMNETVGHYSSDLLRLCKGLMGIDHASRQKFAQTFLIRGLRPEIKEQMAIGYESFDRAVSAAKTFEARLVSCGKLEPLGAYATFNYGRASAKR